jgi:hypothetical protein
MSAARLTIQPDPNMINEMKTCLEKQLGKSNFDFLVQQYCSDTLFRQLIHSLAKSLEEYHHIIINDNQLPDLQASYDDAKLRLSAKETLKTVFIHHLIHHDHEKEPRRQYSIHHTTHDSIWISDTFDGIHCLYVEEPPSTVVRKVKRKHESTLTEFHLSQYRPRSMFDAYAVELKKWIRCPKVTKKETDNEKENDGKILPIHKSKWLVGLNCLGTTVPPIHSSLGMVHSWFECPLEAFLILPTFLSIYKL